jgi:hypothetical protein
MLYGDNTFFESYSDLFDFVKLVPAGLPYVRRIIVKVYEVPDFGVQNFGMSTARCVRAVLAMPRLHKIVLCLEVDYGSCGPVAFSDRHRDLLYAFMVILLQSVPGKTQRRKLFDSLELAEIPNAGGFPWRYMDDRHSPVVPLEDASEHLSGLEEYMVEEELLVVNGPVLRGGSDVGISVGSH